MNDLPDVIKSNLWEFADDTKLYCCISSLTDWTFLQTDLDNFMNWCVNWQSSVNINKCKHMTVGGNSNRQYFISMDDVSVIEQCTEESDLGVTFTTDLKFSCHINNAIHQLSIVYFMRLLHTTYVYCINLL